MSNLYEHLEHNEKVIIRNGIALSIVQNISNNYFSLFAISVLGVTNFQVGLINSLPQIIGLFGTMIGSMIINNLEEKKKFTAFSFLFTRLFLLLMAMVIFLPPAWQGWVFVSLIGLMNFPGAIAQMSWQSFIGDLIPDSRRNNFFSKRNKINTIVGLIATTIVGITLQQFSPNNSIPFQILFMIALFIGILEFKYLMKHKEKKRVIKEKKKLNLGLFVFKHKPFVAFLIVSLSFNFAWQMAWALFSIYNITYAHATALWLSLITISSQLAQILSFKWWAKMADQHSTAKMLFVATLGMALTPFLTVLSTNLPYLIFVNALAGFSLSGTVLLLFNQLLEVTTKENRTEAISNYNILLAIIAFIAPQVGVWILDISNMKLAMNISAGLRFSTGFMFLGLYYYLKKTNQLQLTGE